MSQTMKRATTTDRTKPIPKELPMPEYEYQKPATGTYVLRVDQDKSKQKARREKVPVLSNLKVQVPG